MVEGPASHWLLIERGADAHSSGGTRIAALGRALPEARLSTDDLMASTRHRTGIDLERLTGVRERRVSDGTDDSLSLAVEAARSALLRADCRPKDLDVVISCSITKFRAGLVQWLDPPMSLAVARAIGATSAVTFDVSNACAGMLTGVFILNNWIRQGVVGNGLVVSGECISSLARNAAAHVRNIMSKELASLTLGDAGAAMLLERCRRDEPGITVTGFTTIAEHSRLCVAYPSAGEPGARMFTRSQALQRAAIKDSPTLLREVLEAAGTKIGAIDHVVPHQTSVRAIKKGMAFLEEELGGAPANPAVVTVDHYGNTASTSHTVALVEQLEQGRIHSGDTVALVALASGLVIGVVLFEADEALVRSYGHAA